MSAEASNAFETPEQAWGMVEVGLRNYPDAGADREERVWAVRKIAKGTRQYFLLKGDRQAVVDKVGQMELPVTLLMDTDLALDELEGRYMTNNSQLEEADWNFMEGIVGLREVIEAGKADDPGVSQEFKDRTQRVKGGLAKERKGRVREVMRRVEEGGQSNVRQAVDVLGNAFVNLGKPDWTPEDGEVKQIVDAIKVASARLLPEQYDRVIAGFGIRLFGEIGVAFIAVQERGGILTAEEKVKMGNYVKLFKKSFPMMEGVPVVKKFLLEVERML